MSRLFNEPEILSGLQHDDLYVRSSLLDYVTVAKAACSLECSEAALAIIDKLGWQDAYEPFVNLIGLPIDLDRGRKLLGLLEHESFSQMSEVMQDSAVETVVRWILSGPMDISIVLRNEINPDLLLRVNDESKMLECRARAAEMNEKQCWEALQKYIKKCEHPEFDYKIERPYKVGYWCERLANLGTVDRNRVRKWLALPIELDDAKWSKDSLRVWVALQLAKWAGIAVESDRCLEFLAMDVDLLSVALCEGIERNGDAKVLLCILDQYPEMHTELGTPLMELYERRRFPEVEQALHELVEKGGFDWYTNTTIGIVLCYYASERSMALADKMTLENFDDDDRIEMERMLYGFYKVLGIESDHFEKWLEKFQLLSEMNRKLLAGDSSIFSGFIDDMLTEQGFYSPNTPPDPEEWLSIDDSEKQVIVEAGLQAIEAGIGEGFTFHCVTHIIVENQVAANDADVPTGQVIDSLMEQGLDRHEAIHAVGSVIMTTMHSMVQKKEVFDPAANAADMWALNADDWKGSAPFLPGDPADDDYLSDDSYLDDPLGLDLVPPVTQPIKNKSPKIKRNASCPCGSGKKYKKCCLKFAN